VRGGLERITASEGELHGTWMITPRDAESKLVLRSDFPVPSAGTSERDEGERATFQVIRAETCNHFGRASNKIHAV